MSKNAEKKTSSAVDTVQFSKSECKAWLPAPFQRPLAMNVKVQACAEEIKELGGVLPGIITFGEIGDKRYLIDGQQRRQAFLLTGLEVGYADVRTCQFETMADMAREFDRLNSHLVSMKPDDHLRALECALPALQELRDACPFVGYGFVRRGDKSPLVSMSVALRCWFGAGAEVPGGPSMSSVAVAELFTGEDVACLSDFLACAMTAWGRDLQYERLWGALNLTLCMWVYRKMVLTAYSAKVKKIDREQFVKCLMSLSADPVYCDWLRGRKIGDHDRGPCYARIKALFIARIAADTGAKAMMPQPDWAGHHPSRGNA